MSVKRTVFAADKTGFYMLHTLFERTLKYENIVRYDEWFVTKLFHDGARVSGVFAMDLRRGKRAAFKAKAVILATGGAGKVFAFTTNGNIKTGDGMALAYRAGVPLKDMEFVQFHPTGLPRTGILITEGARGEGGYLLNKDGERFMKRYLPTKMELGPRDIISRCIMAEIKAGRGFEGPHGKYVHLDIRHLGEQIIDEKLPLVREIAKDFAGVDPVYEPIPVMPVCHYFMGGVSTNVYTETAMQGLYAAGETACVTINGANRLGSNSLAECLVFGKVAGERAAAYAQSATMPEISEKECEYEEARLDALLHHEGTERVAVVREEMQRIMQENAGIERNEESLMQGLEAIMILCARAARIELYDKGTIFNTELTSLLELHNMLDIAEAVIRSALHRQESRGSHSRSDFTTRDDAHFLSHTLLTHSESAMIQSNQPVTITQWQPIERKY